MTRAQLDLEHQKEFDDGVILSSLPIRPSTMLTPAAHPTYAAQNMPFRRLGPSGLRVPLFSLGGWLTLGAAVVGDPAKEIIKTAFENGINMFDTAEEGHVINELDLRRTDLVISTKIFWGPRDGPNDKGSSRKQCSLNDGSIIEGAQECLERLQLTYVDVIYIR
ncbi:NADP-dependent oxidoreductase domain-containing protein [Roridomyces roridus]|uniref:NADP-dependent oxidoreductase domain-containing protein n=1 Tax=Roridomyces roridus TaxID=1738132 RepID=A0AAD7B0L6_9AGAR|nr:NADP-dependent oxidoreductase domain-containing protein [Roridomyces roridus]